MRSRGPIEELRGLLEQAQSERGRRLAIDGIAVGRVVNIAQIQRAVASGPIVGGIAEVRVGPDSQIRLVKMIQVLVQEAVLEIQDVVERPRTRGCERRLLNLDSQRVGGIDSSGPGRIPLGQRRAIVAHRPEGHVSEQQWSSVGVAGRAQGSRPARVVRTRGPVSRADLEHPVGGLIRSSQPPDQRARTPLLAVLGELHRR